MTEIEVWAQADVLQVRTTLVPYGQASALETMLLKAIRAGADHHDDLCDVFGLAPRLVESILGDLWRAGRISIDLGTAREKIALTSAARKELDELDKGGSVSSTAVRAGSEEIAYDRLTGRVLPLQATRRFPRERGLVVPTMADDPEPSSLRESDLAEAVSRTLNSRAEERAEERADDRAAERAAGEVSGAGNVLAAGRAGADAGLATDQVANRVGDLRIDTVYLAPTLLQASRERRYVPVRVQASEDATGALAVRVVDDRLPLAAREQATRRLNGLIADRPTSRFAAQLRVNAHRAPLRERDLGQMVADLRSAVETLSVCAPGSRQRWHDRAAALTGDIEAYTKALALTEMDVRVLVTGEQHRAAITGMLERAQRQVVIAVPRVRQRGVLGIRDALIAAVGRGVEVTVLWGVTAATQSLDSKVLATLDEIEEHARTSDRGGALRYHRDRGARSHAKVVVADDRELMVTSQNFLSGVEVAEMGVLLTAPGGRANPPLICPVIGEVLQFLYDHTPDPATAFKLVRTHKGFGSRREEPDLPPVPRPRLTAGVLDPNAPPQHARAWAAAWQETVRAVADRAIRPRPTVEVIKDGQHAALVREALEEAGRRVLIASHRVTGQALTAEVCMLAETRAAEGLDVAMRYGEVEDGESAGRLDRLAASPGTDVRLERRMHAKVVVQDGSTVLGSFNHLSVNAGVRGLRATGDLSVRIASAVVADEVWAGLLGRSSTTSAEVSAGPAAAPGSCVPAQLLLELLQPSDGVPDVEALAGLVQAEGTGEVLAMAGRLELGAAARRRVLAAAALPVLAVPGADREARLAALLPAVWETGAWACADLVRRNISDPGLSPRTVLTSALADPAEHAAVLWAAATGEAELTAAETEVLAVSACAGLLLGELDVPDTVELLRGWERPSAPRSDEFAAAAVGYWAHYGPLPAELSGIVRSGPASQGPTPRELRDDLRAALDALRRYDTHSESGDAVRDRLFGPGGEMTELAAALAAGDTAGLRKWEETYTEVNDSRWLVKATKAAGQPAIDDHRKVSFIEKHRAIRLALRALNSAVAEQERAAGRLEMPAAQAAQLYRLSELLAAMDAAVSVTCPEDVALALRLAPVRARLAGQAPPTPAASLDSWALPRVAVLREDSAPADPPPGELLEAMCRDLAAGWDGPQAVRFLLRQGEFGAADRFIAQLRDHDVIDARQESVLRRERDAARAEAEDLLDAQVREVGLRCDRVGLDGNDPRWGDIGTLGPRLRVSRARCAEAMRELDDAVGKRRKELTDELAACRAQLRPDWARHIEGLIEEEELAVAQLALTSEHRNGRQLLPQPVTLSPWSWRSVPLAEVASWFEPGCADAPSRVSSDFLPEPGDEAAIRVVGALHAVAGGSPQAAAEWLAAVQSLVVETDEPPMVRQAGTNGFTGEFVLPYDVRLPRLCWVGGPPAAVSVGETSGREMVHFSLALRAHRQDVAVVSVSDVLTLLGRDQSGRPASMTNRALRFLSMVCSQLPLDRVIAPHDTPAGHALDRRIALAWLLSILGFNVTPADLDMLRLLGGGHQVPLWHLIDAAREDPVNGIRALRDRPDLDRLLVAGLTADLDSDIDLLVLSAMLWMDVTDRAGARDALALIWEDAEGTPAALDQVDLDAVLGRLIAKGYLKEANGRLRGCSCAVVRAQRRTDLVGQARRLVERVNATLEVRDLMFGELLSYARHADQAEAALRSPEEQRASAHRTSEARMSDSTPFDLGTLCAEQARRADMMRDDVDVYWDSPADLRLWMAGPEMPYEYLVRELLTNAVGAVAGRDQTGRDQTGMVWLSVRMTDDATAELTVSDNGPGFPGDFRAAFQARKPVHRPDRPGRGTGFHKLRLYAEARGARFELGDRPEGGAVVTVYLPLTTGPDWQETA